MNEHKNIKGFFSYARQNDKHGGGNLSSLRKNLEIELREQTGENIEIFQDQEDISWGEFWKTKITTSLNSSKFLIAIVTPSYLKSEACRFELEYFLNLEKIIGSERILPIIYIDTPELKSTKDPVFSEINSRQWFDWTNFRFSPLTSTSAKKKIAIFTKRICELITTEISPTSNNKNDELLSPDNFPKGWDTEWQPSFDKGTTASKPAPKFKNGEPITPPLITHAVTPLVNENKNKDYPHKHLTVNLLVTGDQERDKRRIKTLHGLFTRYHGRDTFSFNMSGKKESYLIDFPNDTTRICPELLDQLRKLIGEEAWRVEEITFQ